MKPAIRDILRECQPFLGLLRAGSGPLFRGVDPAGPRYFRAEVHRKRRPKNMPELLHEAADAWFSSCFGVRYRGAGLFCTGSRAQAKEHGAVSMVFPVEGFQFCWSPQVVDLHKWAKAEGYLTLAPDVFVRELKTLDYRDWDLAVAVASGCEVMVACRNYHAVVVDGEAEGRAFLAELGISENT